VEQPRLGTCWHGECHIPHSGERGDRRGEEGAEKEGQGGVPPIVTAVTAHLDPI